MQLHEVRHMPDPRAQVLTLLELGLVDKEDMTAYYEALENLERSTEEDTEATTSPTKSSTSTVSPSGSSLGQADPASLMPFPVICAALGAAGMHSLQLTGTADTIASVCGGAAGAAVGGIVVIGNDPVGEFARMAGAAIARLVGSAGGWAGKEVSSRTACMDDAKGTYPRKPGPYSLIPMEKCLARASLSCPLNVV